MRHAALLCAAAALLAGCGSQTSARVAAPARAAAPIPSFRGVEASPALPAPDLALRDQDGKLVRLSALRGHPVLLTFLYTACTDVCPLIASNLSAAVRSLPPSDRTQVRVLAVSVDPHGDTRAAVRKFVRARHLVPQFRYLTGTKAQLAPVWQSWNVLVEARNLERVEHSAFVWLVDPRGRARVSYHSDVDPGTVAHDLRAILA